MTMPYALCSSSASEGRQQISVLAATLLALALCGCSTTDTANMIGSAADGALNTIGLKRASVDSTTGFDEIALRIHAARNLNATPDGKGTALVLHLYKLRSADAFMAMSPEAVLLPGKEKEILGADLIEVRELVVTPAQKLELKEKVTKEASFVAIAAAYRTPAPLRWRVAFDRGAAAKSGVLLGAHACALSVSAGEAIGWAEDQPSRLAAARCGAPGQELK